MGSEAKEETKVRKTVGVVQAEPRIIMVFEKDWQELKAAEQRAADIEARTANKLGEFAKLVDIIDAECKRLGIEWHGSASTTLKAVIEAAGVQPGDVVLRPTGEVRKVRDGEWYGYHDDRFALHSGYLTVSKFPIYRRLESPANQSQQGEPTCPKCDSNRRIAMPATSTREGDMNLRCHCGHAYEYAAPSPAPAEEPEPTKYQANPQPEAKGANETDHSITLTSGEAFSFLDPDASKFTIEDIARGLSKVCRFAGQCGKFYSVAEHSVYVSRIASGNPLAALLHDASEAFMGDVPRPLKRLIPQYREIEQRIEKAVYERFGCASTPAVKDADYRAFATEVMALMPKEAMAWVPAVEPADFVPQCLSPINAERLFLARFAELTASPSPALPEEDGEADWSVEAARVRPSGRLEFVVYRKSRELTQGDAEAAADWLNRRAEIEAQLAKYKRDAEAWEKDHRAMEAMERHSMSVVQCYPDWRACVMGRDHEGVIRASHLDAVLSLAAQLEQKGEGK